MSLSAVALTLDNVPNALSTIAGLKTLTIKNGSAGPITVKVRLFGGGAADPSEFVTVTSPANFSFEDSCESIALEVINGSSAGATAEISGPAGRADQFGMTVPPTGIAVAVDTEPTGTPHSSLRTFMLSDTTDDSKLQIESSADNVLFVTCKTREGTDAFLDGSNKLVSFHDNNRYFRLRRLAGASGAVDLCTDVVQLFPDVIFSNFFGLTVSAAQPITAVGSKPSANSSLNQLNNTSGGALVLNSTPTIDPIPQGAIVTFVNISANNITLQDDATLPGSNLFLGAATRVLAQWAQITLMFVAGKWIERSYTA